MAMCEDDAHFESDRLGMIERDLRGRDITDPDVLRVMGEIPREEFVPLEQRDRAYSDQPLPIADGQTISQPYIVALMTQLLRLTRECEVLEVGTGSGYQTAILARLAGRVCTMERLPELLAGAQGVLRKLGIDNVSYELGDGSLGWPASRTFDRIMITAAVPDFPPPLVGQLAESGVIVAPLGQEAVQQLVVAEKRLGKLIERDVTNCRFVRLIGEHGFVCRM
ncbi:MAG: protein-L-isoaspartate(D-aspartate) O-methyltransferase [Phycisphaerae bacterium]|nr:protein-L-isoaspartate(D-aspartate) O-methyltransferase [Phycisphaerae bacterium]